MNHYAAKSFWDCYESFSDDVQKLADARFELLKYDPKHPSLHFKQVGPYWSARISINLRCLAVEIDEGFLWFWMGNHDAYERLIKNR